MKKYLIFLLILGGLAYSQHVPDQSDLKLITFESLPNELIEYILSLTIDKNTPQCNMRAFFDYSGIAQRYNQIMNAQGVYKEWSDTINNLWQQRQYAILLILQKNRSAIFYTIFNRTLSNHYVYPAFIRFASEKTDWLNRLEYYDCCDYRTFSNMVHDFLQNNHYYEIIQLLSKAHSVNKSPTNIFENTVNTTQIVQCIKFLDAIDIKINKYIPERFKIMLLQLKNYWRTYQNSLINALGTYT